MKPEQRIDDLVTRLNEANAKYRLGEQSGMKSISKCERPTRCRSRYARTTDFEAIIR